MVLVEPEIPPNTGSVARTCAATGSSLYLIEPLGFQIDDHAVRRAGLDYWHLVDLNVLPNLDAFFTANPSTRCHLFSSEASQSYLDADFKPGDALIFGKESVGLRRELLSAHKNRVWGIPTSGKVRSINLSNAVAIVLFEALRKNDALGNTYIK